MLTGLDSKSFERLQLNAGVFLRDFDYSNIKSTSELKTALVEAMKDDTHRLGATRGGGNFQAVPTTREIEADGKRYAFKGSTVYDYWDIRMSGTLLEFVKGTLKALLATADEETVGTGITKFTLRTQPKDEDYMNLVWVGDTSQGYLMIGLKNALNTVGMNFTFTDKGEGTLPFEFHASQDKVEDYDTAPVDIFLLEPTAS